MAKSKDLSGKDSKYFVDGRTYNCPFCNRRNVSYEVETTEVFTGIAPGLRISTL